LANGTVITRDRIAASLDRLQFQLFDCLVLRACDPLHGSTSSRPFSFARIAYDAPRNANNHSMIRYVVDDNRCGTDHCAATDRDISKYRRVRAGRHARPHDRSQHLPIGLALEVAFCGGGVRLKVVDELHAVANKDLIFDLHVLTNENCPMRSCNSCRW